MADPDHSPNARDGIRDALRAQRRELTGEPRTAAETRILRAIGSLPAYRSARHIAAYFAIDGEVDVTALIAHAKRRNKSVYVPVLRDERLSFALLEPGTVLGPNRYGIPEPRNGEMIDPRSLDLVLTPLVAFDKHGARLGMGKAYYDRTFHFLLPRCAWLKPKLLGVAFAFQEVAALAVASWDVPLWGIVTDSGAQQIDRRRTR